MDEEAQTLSGQITGVLGSGWFLGAMWARYGRTTADGLIRPLGATLAFTGIVALAVANCRQIRTNPATAACLLRTLLTMALVAILVGVASASLISQGMEGYLKVAAISLEVRLALWFLIIAVIMALALARCALAVAVLQACDRRSKR